MKQASNTILPYISVSAFACQKANRIDYLTSFNWEKVDALHIDIMDGICVPLTGLTFSEVTDLDMYTSLPLDIHLMVKDQKGYLDKLLTLKNIHVVILTIESFSCKLIRDLLHKIHAAEKIPGIAIWPDSDLNQVSKFIDLIDILLIMSTEAGTPNSQYKENTYEKILLLQASLPSNIALWVDGAMNKERASNLSKIGASGFVFGRAFFDPSQTDCIRRLKE